METHYYDDSKYVEIWLTGKESADESVRQSLKPLYAAYKAKKYRVVVLESGNENLLESTKGLICHAVELEARIDASLYGNETG